jgi:hypothetical protein
MVGCASRPPAPTVDFEKDFFTGEGERRAENFLTHRRCVSLSHVHNECHRSIDAGSKLQLDGIERGITSSAYYHVKLEDGRTGYISAFHLVRLGTDVDPAQAAAECKRRGNPRVGMTAKQVRATCWGEPDHVDRRETARGVTERYVYDDGRVILHNGVVTSVQISGTLR